MARYCAPKIISTFKNWKRVGRGRMHHHTSKFSQHSEDSQSTSPCGNINLRHGLAHTVCIRGTCKSLAWDRISRPSAKRSSFGKVSPCNRNFGTGDDLLSQPCTPFSFSVGVFKAFQRFNQNANNNECGYLLCT